MDNVSREEFLKQMKFAIDLETGIATQDAIIRSYLEQTERIKPVLYEEEIPPKPIAPTYYEPDWFGKYSDESGYGYGAVFGSVASLLLFGFLAEVNLIPALLISIVGVLLSVIPITVKKIAIKNRNDAKRKEYNDAYTQWEEMVSDVNATNAKRNSEYSKETDIWLSTKKRNAEELRIPLRDTENLLDELYSKDFIYNKYRNLPALTSIYEYFITGRCDELTGPHGAYNLYEDEVRKDTVISQLSQVIENLEQIKQNQYMLYNQVKIMRENTEIISREIATIRSYTGSIMELSAVNAYYSALTARNTEISATMHLLNG